MNKILWNYKTIDVINESKNIDLCLLENDYYIVNVFCSDVQMLSINVNQEENSQCILNVSTINKENSTLKIQSDIKGSNNKLFINVHCLSKKDNMNCEVVSKVSQNTVNNEVVEDLKGLNENGGVCFLPILEVDTNNVLASHYATVGSLDENMIFYMQCKGLSKEAASRLLKENFIYGLFNDDFVSQIKKRKENYE